ncbi:MAG: protoporphyrinogen oxidase [Planctomycetota bacterium]|nr:protoporphyrinogen oxidase [Planctomycetota bacterium]
MQVGIVGAGISGLTLAYRLRQQHPEWKIDVWESTKRCGGVLHTSLEDNSVVEMGADSFLVSADLPWAADLARELGLADDLLDTSEKFRRALVVHRGRLAPLPPGFQLLSPGKIGSVLGSPLLSWKGKLRLACEGLVRRRVDTSDESLASFAKRRLGLETFERIVEPLVGGIYTADANLLSMEAALPQFVQQEREFGSLTRAAATRRTQSNTTGARYSLFQAPRHGLGMLVTKLMSAIGPESVHFDYDVNNIVRQLDGRWTVEFNNHPAHNNVDILVFSVPAHVTSVALTNTVPKAARLLGEIPYASSAVVHLTYDQTQFTKPLDAFGFVVPRIEGLPILAGSFSSIKFPQRARSGQEAVRVFLGGALQSDLLRRDDSELIQLAHNALVPLLQIRGPSLVQRIVRWDQRMPQYHLGHRDRVARIRQEVSTHPGLYLIGNYLDGVGIPQCIHTASRTAAAIDTDLKSRKS